MIDGVIIKPLKRIPDDRGIIMKMQEASDPEFKGFGEIYFSTVYPGIVKGWHLHKHAILNYAVIKGHIKLVLFDNREHSKTQGEIQEIYIGDANFALVQIPANVWNGFMGVGTEPAIIADLITVVHEEDEMVRIDPHQNALVKYNWRVRDR